MSDYCFNGLVKFRVDSKIAHDDYHLLGDDNHHSHRRGNLKSYKIAHVSATDICSNGGIVCHFSTSPVTCASELEVALLQALDVLPKFH
jgi:hypothetical protein